MYAGLTSAFSRIALFGQAGQSQDAERGLYVDFLTEASLVLNRPTLKDVAHQFRASGQAWRELAQALLPDEIPLFKETRAVMLDQHRLFPEQGNAAGPAIQHGHARLAELKAEVAAFASAFFHNLHLIE
jgi:hypothetical protein